MNNEQIEHGRFHGDDGQERLRTILAALHKGSGRLVYLPSKECYRAAGTDVDVGRLEVAALLQQRLIRPVSGTGQPYMLTTEGLQRLALLNSELIRVKQTGPLGG